MIFLQFRAFPRNCRILCWLGSAPQYQNGFPVRLQTGSRKRILHCTEAMSWHCKLCSLDLSDAQCLRGFVHGILPMTRMLCFRSMIFQYPSAESSMQAAGTVCFLPHIHAGYHLRTCCNPKGCFLGLWCRKKACGCHFRFWGA